MRCAPLKCINSPPPWEAFGATRHPLAWADPYCQHHPSQLNKKKTGNAPVERGKKFTGAKKKKKKMTGQNIIFDIGRKEGLEFSQSLLQKTRILYIENIPRK